MRATTIEAAVIIAKATSLTNYHNIPKLLESVSKYSFQAGANQSIECESKPCAVSLRDQTLVCEGEDDSDSISNHLFLLNGQTFVCKGGETEQSLAWLVDNQLYSGNEGALTFAMVLTILVSNIYLLALLTWAGIFQLSLKRYEVDVACTCHHSTLVVTKLHQQYQEAPPNQLLHLQIQWK